MCISTFVPIWTTCCPPKITLISVHWTRCFSCIFNGTSYSNRWCSWAGIRNRILQIKEMRCYFNKYSKTWTCVKRPLSKRQKIGFQDQLSLNAGQKYCRMLQGEMLQGEHSAILLTFIKLPFVLKIFVLSIFEWLFYTGFTVKSTHNDVGH